jgi:hypothetical protein
MKFSLFSKITFEVKDALGLIEAYCFQTDFYRNYDLLAGREVEHVNRIGARINRDLLRRCKTVTNSRKNLPIFKYNFHKLMDLTEATRSKHIKELNNQVIEKLLKINGISLSAASKVLHTLYPEIIPMIDNQLQKEYRAQINNDWAEKQSDQILVEYYKNFKMGETRKNLEKLFKELSKRKLRGLSRVRIFDILWWSYLKAKRLKEDNNINWSTIR